MRRSVIGLAKRRGMEAIERRNMPEELTGFEESFVSGTGSEVTQVCEAGPYKFTPGAISFVLINDNFVGLRTRQKAA
jgi:branched-chain amino acid aminotransferase